jgi:hypothetical protein
MAEEEPAIREEDLDEEVPDKDYVLDDVGVVEVGDELRAEIFAEAQEWVAAEWPEAHPHDITAAAAEVADLRVRTFETGVLNYRQSYDLGQRLVERFNQGGATAGAS